MTSTTIHKYRISLETRQRIAMPKGAVILTVDLQHEQMCLWANVPMPGEGFRDLPPEPAADSGYELRTIEIFSTGHLMDGAERKYIGTVLAGGGDLVWHVFERS